MFSQEDPDMKTFSMIRTGIAFFYLFGAASAQASPEIGGDYSFVGYKNLLDADTVINTVVVKCPAAGTLVANASAQISMNSVFAPGEADVIYGITKNSTATDINQHHLLRQYTDTGTTWATASYQRTDACVLNQTVTYRFIAHKVSAQSASAEKSSLAVTFVRDKI
jgi:hypothetical protein